MQHTTSKLVTSLFDGELASISCFSVCHFIDVSKLVMYRLLKS